MTLKKGIRILALDDSPFTKGDTSSRIIGVVGNKGAVEGVLSFNVAIDGDDATERLIYRVKSSKFAEQIKVVVTNGITFAGLNIIDIGKVSSSLEVPVIAVTRRKPQKGLLEKAVSHCADHAGKMEILEALSKRAEIIRMENYYIQSIGIGNESIKHILADSVRLLRLSHMIAGGVARGESKGRL